MNDIVRHPVTVVWAMLVIATLAVFTLAEQRDFGTPALIGIIVIAAFKVRLVFLWFMELRSGAMPWRAVAELWIALVAAILITGVLVTSTP